jgi:hypothetical protein
MGRKPLSAANMSRAGSVIRSASSAAGEVADVKRAEEQYESLVQEQQELESLVNVESRQIADQFDPAVMPLTTLEITPRKADTIVDQVALLWLPWIETDSGNLERAF